MRKSSGFVKVLLASSLLWSLHPFSIQVGSRSIPGSSNSVQASSSSLALCLKIVLFPERPERVDGRERLSWCRGFNWFKGLFQKLLPEHNHQLSLFFIDSSFSSLGCEGGLWSDSFPFLWGKLNAWNLARPPFRPFGWQAQTLGLRRRPPVGFLPIPNRLLELAQCLARPPHQVPCGSFWLVCFTTDTDT